MCPSSRWIPLTTADRRSMNKWHSPTPAGTLKCKWKCRLRGGDSGETESSEASNLPVLRIQPLPMDSSAYSFTAFAGVPAVEFSFMEVRLPGPCPRTPSPQPVSATFLRPAPPCPGRMIACTHSCTRRRTHMRICTRYCEVACPPWSRRWLSSLASSSSD